MRLKGSGLAILILTFLMIMPFVYASDVWPVSDVVTVQGGCTVTNGGSIQTSCPQDEITYSDDSGSITLPVAEWKYRYGPTFGCECAIDTTGFVDLSIQNPYSHGVRGRDKESWDEFWGPDHDLTSWTVDGYPYVYVKNLGNGFCLYTSESKRIQPVWPSGNRGFEIYESDCSGQQCECHDYPCPDECHDYPCHDGFAYPFVALGRCPGYQPPGGGGGGSSSICGDGRLGYGIDEQCDDGNTISGDGCSENCTSEWFNITSGSVMPYDCIDTVCYPGDKLAILLNVKGDALYEAINYLNNASISMPPDYMDLPNFVYVNVSSDDGSCKISLSGNIPGMVWNMSAGNNWPQFFECFDWEYISGNSGQNYCDTLYGYIPKTIPRQLSTLFFTLQDVPTACYNKQLTKFTINVMESTSNPVSSVAYSPYNGVINPPITLKKNICGDGIITPPEVCDGSNFGGKTCLNPYGYGLGTLSCTNSCTNISVSGCYYNVTDIFIYPTAQGCSGQTCGSNSQVTVIVTLAEGQTIDPGNIFDLNVRSPTNPYGYCEVTYLDTVITSPQNDLIQYTGTILRDTVESQLCRGFIVNETYNTKIIHNGVQKSNILIDSFTGIKLHDCGDGQIDNLPAIYPDISQYNESCDGTNLNGKVCTNFNYSAGKPYTGGTLSCLNDCQGFNFSQCYSCGDGNVNPGEECDDGNNNNYDLCNNTCRNTFCGDSRNQWPNGVYKNGTFKYNTYLGNNSWGFEQCDDGNLNQFDSCANNCTHTFCGDTRIQWPNGVGLLGGNITVYECPPNGCPMTYWGYETCDDGNSMNNDRCYNCLNTTCGDGIKQWPNGVYKDGIFAYNPYLGYGSWGFEQCDDGNRQLTDACANNCTWTFCGDNILQEYGNGLGNGGRLDNGMEECDSLSDPNCVNCVLYSCGNGKIDPGEECDDGGVCSEDPTHKCTDDSFCQERDSGICITKSGDGCSATCKATNCTINQVTLSGCAGGVCGKGDIITVSTYFSGSNCSLANSLQVDYLNLSLNDGDCMIQYEPIGGQLQGMNATFNAMRNPFIFNYAVPSVTDLCAGKELDFVITSLTQKFDLIGYKSSSGIIRTNNDIYSFNVASTKFDQCKEYGEVFNYTNYGVDTGYDVILNSNTNCYYQTCSNYDARNVLFIDERGDYGVRLWNDSKNDYDDYLCRTDIEDNVCPDDFQYEGSCRNGELSNGGVCANNNVKDADCEIKTPMKCGITWNGTTMVDTCNVPLLGNPPTPPSKYCGDNSMCVYANEITGENTTCIAVNQTLQNFINKTIWCSNYNYFCPLGYQHNGTHCYNPIRQCVDKCPDVVDVSRNAYDPARLKTLPVWQSYINDSDCFLKNNETNRRRAYCGIGYVWPAINYHYLGIGVYYWSILPSGEIIFSGTDSSVGGNPVILEGD